MNTYIYVIVQNELVQTNMLQLLKQFMVDFLYCTKI